MHVIEIGPDVWRHAVGEHGLSGVVFTGPYTAELRTWLVMVGSYENAPG